MIKTIPYSLEAESALLGTILIDNEIIVKASQLIDKEDFYSEAFKNIYQSMFNLFVNREPIDLITLSEDLKKRNLLEKIGGITILSELSTNVQSTSQAMEYVKIIKDKSMRRLIMIKGEELINSANDESKDYNKNLGIFYDSIIKKLNRTQPKTIKECSSILLGDILSCIDQKKKKGVELGYEILDELTGGLRGSNLVIAGARPSVGKTMFVLQSILNCSEMGYKVGFFSLEMSQEEILERLYANYADIYLSKIKNRSLENIEIEKLSRKMDELSKREIFIDDTAYSDVDQIIIKANKMKLVDKIDILFIDYLGLISTKTNYNTSEHLKLGEISKKLKLLAKHLNIPVFALHQLSRDIDRRQDKTPRLSDLRDSGSLEQDADIVMFFDRPNLWDKNSPPEEMRLYVKKNRGGQIDDILLDVNLSKQRITESDLFYSDDEY